MYDIRSSLHSIMLQKKGICRSQSYENFRAEKGAAAQTSSVLGKSRKGTPFRLDLKAGEIFELAEIGGRGVIRQFFITVTDQQENGPCVLEKLILRMYWEKEEQPSVECPLGDFFGCGNNKITLTDMEPSAKGRQHVVEWGSMPVRMMTGDSPISIVPARSFHCYFPMPFQRHARITLENCYGAAVSVVAYQVTYTLEEDEESASMPEYTHFHAKHTKCRWNSDTCSLTEIAVQESDAVSYGKTGTYVGVYLSVSENTKHAFEQAFLKITSCTEDGDCWYEPVSGNDLSNGGFFSFRMLNPIQFEKMLDISLITLYDVEETEFDSVVYWYV